MRRNHEGVLFSESDCLDEKGEKYVDAKGRKYERVSNVLRRMGEEPTALNEWKKRLGERADVIGEETSSIGTLIHKVTALHDLGRMKERDEIIEKEPRILPYLLFWEEWVNEYVKRMIAVEVVVFDSVYGIAGTIDRVLQIKGDTTPSIGDIKTGIRIGYKKIDIQVRGAYLTMWNENRVEWRRKDHMAERTIVIHMPRWRSEEELLMGKADTTIKEVKVKEVTGEWAQTEWKRMRKDWKEME